MANLDPTFIDLFAGCGGLSLGLLQAGWTGLLAVEKDPLAFATLRHNLIDVHPLNEKQSKFHWPTCIPVQPYDVKQFLIEHSAALHGLRGSVTMVAGGPPCQGFSLAGRRQHEDPRNELFRVYLSVVDIIRPSLVLLENVQGIRLPFGKSTDNRRSYSDRIKYALRRRGYHVQQDVLMASQYGVPQLRPRFFTVAVRSDLLSHRKPDIFSLVRAARVEFLRDKGLPTDRPVTVSEAISDLRTEGRTLTHCTDPDSPPGFQEIVYERPETEYQELMHDGASADTMNSLRLVNHRPETIKRFMAIASTCRAGVQLTDADRRRLGLRKNALAPLSADRPSHTITTLPDDLLHYREPRVHTVREYARLQSFPDWFHFAGKFTTGGLQRAKECPRYTQVGNAVPPLLAEIIGKALMQLVEALPPEGRGHAGIVRLDAGAPAPVSRSDESAELAQKGVIPACKKRPTAQQLRGAQQKLLDWYRVSGRDFQWRQPDCCPYSMVIAEVLLQRTKADRVAGAIAAFLDRFPSWEALARSSTKEVEDAVRPLGLWRRRSLVLQRLARSVTAKGGELPSIRADIEALPGVGQYIANAIELFCLGRPRPLLDVNMARVLERLYGSRRLADIRYDVYLQHLSAVFVEGPHIRELNWAVLDLAALVCTTRKPQCASCPLNSDCLYSQGEIYRAREGGK